MRKILTLLFIMITFIFGSFAKCENLPDLSYRKQLNSEDNPVYYKYMEDYFNILKKAFYADKCNKNHVGGGYKYIVHKDGSITDVKMFLIDEEEFNEIIKSIILNNPPPPFYEGMDVEEMHFETFLGVENYDRTRIEYYAFCNSFEIDVVKKHK